MQKQNAEAECEVAVQHLELSAQLSSATAAVAQSVELTSATFIRGFAQPLFVSHAVSSKIRTTAKAAFRCAVSSRWCQVCSTLPPHQPLSCLLSATVPASSTFFQSSSF
ncbi:uncharacterized protein DS421_13g404420 [Arachis hypogaea]|nr:uncharacterized protein DS421_13g404420 [Arachis hypogaea]